MAMEYTLLNLHLLSQENSTTNVSQPKSLRSAVFSKVSELLWTPSTFQFFLLWPDDILDIKNQHLFWVNSRHLYIIHKSVKT